jgi:GNAT superfamily N-acetyltransferase
MKEYRKYGFGRVLVEKLEEAAAEAGRQGKAEVKDGKVLVKCHSQVSPRFPLILSSD